MLRGEIVEGSEISLDWFLLFTGGKNVERSIFVSSVILVNPKRRSVNLDALEI